MTGKGNKNRSVVLDWILLTAHPGMRRKTQDQVKVLWYKKEWNEIKKKFWNLNVYKNWSTRIKAVREAS